MDKDRAGPPQRRSTGNPCLAPEKRVDPGRMDRNPERVNPPSKLSPAPPLPKGQRGPIPK